MQVGYRITVLIGIFCSLLLVCGCETVGETVSKKMSTGLDSCLGKLDKETAVMRFSSPSEKVPLDGGGEIWIYKYRKAVVETTGNGSLLFPLTSESEDKALDVRLQFNKEGLLTGYSYRGNVASFDNPFADLHCN